MMNSDEADGSAPVAKTPQRHVTVRRRARSALAKSSKSARRKTPLEVVGWREWAVLPFAGETPVRAKIDTGAATSSVHASNILESKDPFGCLIASFDLHLHDDRSIRTPIRTHRVVASRMVLSSSGHWSLRPVVNVRIGLGETSFDADLTLASRDEMEFRLLIGRAALRRRFTVDPSRSFVLGNLGEDEGDQ